MGGDGIRCQHLQILVTLHTSTIAAMDASRREAETHFEGGDQKVHGWVAALREADVEVV